MPIRITCPACSAALNLKDELAGRAVKCPRCGGTIPATATKAPPPAPAFEVVEDDAPPAPAPKPKVRSRPAPVIVVDDDDEDEAPRPSKRREKPARSKRNERIVAGMVAYWILGTAACAWLTLRDPDSGTNSDGKSASAKGQPDTESPEKPWLDVPGPATFANYQKIKLTETRGELEAMFGPGETPARSEFSLAFSSTSISYRTWLPMVDKGRVMMWRNNKDRLCVCFTPDGRAQAKLFETHTPYSAVSEGKLVD
jgi:predicted Zn finger-like uncharacterized protein